MNICVFGASGDELDPRYFDAARALGDGIARAGHRLIFGGGGHGLMGACARGAAAAGGEVVGVAPRFFDEPGILFEGCTRLLFTETMAERKSAMAREAEAFIALPGGIGTFEEFFEMLTLKQLGRHGKPMALLNTLGYYDPLYELLRRSAEGGFMSRGCLELFALCGRPEDALHHAETCAPLSGGVRRLADYTK